MKSCQEDITVHRRHKFPSISVTAICLANQKSFEAFSFLSRRTVHIWETYNRKLRARNLNVNREGAKCQISYLPARLCCQQWLTKPNVLKGIWIQSIVKRQKKRRDQKWRKTISFSSPGINESQEVQNRCWQVKLPWLRHSGGL